MDKERGDIERLFAEMAVRRGEVYDAPEYPTEEEESGDGEDVVGGPGGEDGAGWVAAAARWARCWLETVLNNHTMVCYVM